MGCRESLSAFFLKPRMRLIRLAARRNTGGGITKLHPPILCPNRFGVGLCLYSSRYTAWGTFHGLGVPSVGWVGLRMRGCSDAIRIYGTTVGS